MLTGPTTGPTVSKGRRQARTPCRRSRLPQRGLVQIRRAPQAVGRFSARLRRPIELRRISVEPRTRTPGPPKASPLVPSPVPWNKEQPRRSVTSMWNISRAGSTNEMKPPAIGGSGLGGLERSSTHVPINPHQPADSMARGAGRRPPPLPQPPTGIRNGALRISRRSHAGVRRLRRRWLGTRRFVVSSQLEPAATNRGRRWGRPGRRNRCLVHRSRTHRRRRAPRSPLRHRRSQRPIRRRDRPPRPVLALR